MDGTNLIETKDGDPIRPLLIVEAPPIGEVTKQKFDGIFKKKRRRGKSKRKIMKPFSKIPWQERRKNDQSKRKNRFRKIVLAKTQAPFNNNQFLMEIHKPEPENNFYILRTPSARTRDSSFSVDSEENYFYSLPEDEEEYLAKEFSSVYEDAQSERLSNMSKNELIEEYLLLEAKYDNLLKRTDRNKTKDVENENAVGTDTTSVTDKDSMVTDRDTSGASIVSGSIGESSIAEIMQRLKEQENQIHELQLANDKLRLENEHLRHQSQGSSEDSESDSSSSSDSNSSSSCCASPVSEIPASLCEDLPNGSDIHTNGEELDVNDLHSTYPLVNGFHSPSE